MYTQTHKPKISEEFLKKALSDTSRYKSQGALEQDPDNWRNV